jgi:hypothetical protein
MYVELLVMPPPISEYFIVRNAPSKVAVELTVFIV